MDGIAVMVAARVSLLTVLRPSASDIASMCRCLIPGPAHRMVTIKKYEFPATASTGSCSTLVGPETETM